MRRTAGTSLALFTMVLGLLAAPLTTGAQPAGKVYRIGYLGYLAPTTPEASRI